MCVVSGVTSSHTKSLPTYISVDISQWTGYKSNECTLACRYMQKHDPCNMSHTEVGMNYASECLILLVQSAAQVASYPGSSTEKRGVSLEDFITCLVT